MKLEYIGTIIAITVISISGFISYNTLEDKRLASLEKSLESSTSRGINPVAVRCAYAKSDDQICTVYIATKNANQSKE